jgi:hypothetical protein
MKGKFESVWKLQRVSDHCWECLKASARVWSLLVMSGSSSKILITAENGRTSESEPISKTDPKCCKTLFKQPISTKTPLPFNQRSIPHHSHR